MTTRTPGSTDQSVSIHMADSSDGTDKTDLTYSDFTVSYRRGETGALVSVTPATLAAVTTAHTDGGMIHVSGGEYRLDLPDAAVAAGADRAYVFASASGAVQTGGALEVDLSALTAQQTRDAMKLAPTAGSPAAGSVDADLDTLLSRTASGVTANVINPVAPDGATLNLVIDDDYTTSGDDARPWVINVPTSRVNFAFAKITSVELAVRDAQSETLILKSTGSAIETTATVDGEDDVDVFQCSGDITSAQSGQLTRGRKTALFDLTFILDDGARVTAVPDGYVNVSGGGDL